MKFQFSAAGAWQTLLLASLAFITPLFIWPAAVDSYVLPKWTMLVVGTILFGITIAWGMMDRLPVRVGFHPINGFLFLTFVWDMISVAWAPSSELAWMEVRRTGALLVAILLAQSLLTSRRDRVLLVAKGIQGASLLVAIWAIAVDAQTAFASSKPGVVATLGDWRDYVSTASFGNTGHVADFVVIGFLAWLGSFVLTRSPRVRVFSAFALWIHAAALIVTWSVHSNLSLIVASIALVLILRGSAKLFAWNRSARWIGLLCGFAAVVAFYVVDHPANPHGSAVWNREGSSKNGGIFAQAFSSPRWAAGAPTREAIWLTSLEIIRADPWGGTGAGNFTFAYPAHRSVLVEQDPKLAPYASTWTNAAHNDLLQTWAETGIVGLFLLLGVVAVSLKQSWDRISEPGESPGTRFLLALGASALIAQLVQMQMSFPLQLPISRMIFFGLLVLPELLPARGGAGDQRFFVLVQRHVGPLRVRIKLENMQIPRELGLTLPLTLPQRCAAILPVVALGAWIGWGALKPLRADMAYRPAREAKRLFDQLGGNPADPRAVQAAQIVERSAKATLAIWPGHVDCRSGFSDLLVRTGRFSEAIEQGTLVSHKLNATEVYLRQAISLDSTNQPEAALPYWQEVFRRRPDYGDMYPNEANRVLAAEAASVEK